MTYRELIELYKNGKLEDGQKEKVEKDIERQEAISEYLFEQDNMDAFLNLPEDDTHTDDIAKAANDESDKFVKMIRSSVRKMFIKTGAIVTAIVLSLVYFLIYQWPQIEDKMYYDPSEIVGETSLGKKTNRMSLDMAVYTELFIPTSHRDSVTVSGNGHGKYDFVIEQHITYTEQFTNVGGTINKGEMILFNPNLLKTPYNTSFLPPETLVDDGFLAGYLDDSWDYVEDLSDGDYYTAYITLDKVMNYTELNTWANANDLYPQWCALCEKSPGMINSETYVEGETEYITSDLLLGFLNDVSSRPLGYDEDKYPLLSQYDLANCSKDNNYQVSEEDMTQHVLSLFRYMAEQKDFCKMMRYDDTIAEYLNRMADNVEKNGLNIYGFTLTGQKEDFMKLNEIEGIHMVKFDITQ